MIAIRPLRNIASNASSPFETNLRHTLIKPEDVGDAARRKGDEFEGRTL